MDELPLLPDLPVLVLPLDPDVGPVIVAPTVAPLVGPFVASVLVSAALSDAESVPPPEASPTFGPHPATNTTIDVKTKRMATRSPVGQPLASTNAGRVGHVTHDASVL